MALFLEQEREEEKEAYLVHMIPRSPPSIVCPSFQSRNPLEWKSEKYCVRAQVVELIQPLLQTPPLTIDAFSESLTARCSKWWGPGSQLAQDAFKENWSSQFFWMNPPFSSLAKVVRKIREDGAHGILIIPDWQYTKWYKELSPHVLSSVLFSKGSRVFELGGEVCKGVRWPTRAVHFCGHTPLCQTPLMEPILVPKEDCYPVT